MLKLQDIAKRYMAQGFNVIPILPEQKKPAQKWMEFNDRKANPLELQNWFAGKQTNIGIVTGEISKIVVVDIDKPELYDAFSKEYPTHRVQRTASGGYHLLYRYDGKDIGNSVSRLSNGIDVRGNHGYIVTYPSVIRLANGTLGEYHWQEEGELTPLPVKLHDIIVNELSKQHNITTSDKQDDAKTLFNRVLLNGFTPGRHNEEAKDIARYLYRSGMNESLITDLIINALSALNSKDDTPLPASELMATINSGVNYERKRMDAKAGVENAGKQPFDAISGVDLMIGAEGHTNDYLIEDWIPANSLLVVTAPPESYKTWIALEAAVQIALGPNSTGFLGREWKGPKEPTPVLIVQQEDNQDKIAERWKTITQSKARNAEYGYMETGSNGVWSYNNRLTGKREFAPDVNMFIPSVYQMPIFFHTTAQLSFDDPESLVELEKKIKEHGIKFVVIDPLYSLGSSDDFFAGMARKLLPIKALRKKYGCTFLFVHHNKKGTKGAKTTEDMEREGMFGSQLLNGAFEGMLLINKLANGTRVIKRTGKAFDGKKDAFSIEFDISTHYSYNPEIDEGEQSHYDVRISAAQDFVLDEDSEAMRDALANMLEGTINAIATEAGVTGNRDKIKKKFEVLINLGIAVPKEGATKSGGQIYEFAKAN